MVPAFAETRRISVLILTTHLPIVEVVSNQGGHFVVAGSYTANARVGSGTGARL